jgi:hypothetical protein
MIIKEITGLNSVKVMENSIILESIKPIGATKE